MTVGSSHRKGRHANTEPGDSRTSGTAMPWHLIPYPQFDPILLRIGPLAVRWYALAYIAGILLGWLYARALIRNQRHWGGPAPMTLADFDDFVLWVTLGIILGGRAGYVLFYNLPHFLAHPAEIIALWHGGMSFHGGFTGCVLAVVLFARRRRISILSLGDVTCAVGPIGLFLGRLANFVNGELWGRPTDVPWAMIFPGGGAVPRPGLVVGAFACGYAVARIACEFFREPDVQLGFLWGGITMGQLLSIPLFFVGLAFMLYAAGHRPLRKA